MLGLLQGSVLYLGSIMPSIAGAADGNSVAQKYEEDGSKQSLGMVS